MCICTRLDVVRVPLEPRGLLSGVCAMNRCVRVSISRDMTLTHWAGSHVNRVTLYIPPLLKTPFKTHARSRKSHSEGSENSKWSHPSEQRADLCPVAR